LKDDDDNDDISFVKKKKGGGLNFGKELCKNKHEVMPATTRV